MSRLFVLAIAAIASCATASHARAQSTATWTGGAASGNWSTAANWTLVPTTSDSWALVFGGTTQTTGTNTIGTITVNSLSFTNDGSAGNNSVFTISGSTLALSSATITTTAATGGALANPGDVIAASSTLSGANTVALGAGHNLTISGVITGAGSLSVNASGTGATLFLSGSNGYSGGTTITSGLVQNGLRSSTTDYNDNAFGSGTVVVSGSGSAVIRNNSTITNNFTIAGSGAPAATGTTTQGALRGSFGTSGATATLAGSVTLTNDATIKTAASSGVSGSKLLLSGSVDLGSHVLTFAPGVAASGTAPLPIEVSGTIAGTGSVVVDGDPLSRVLLMASNGYSGGTTIRSSTLAVGNATALGGGAVAVDGGTLDLNGTALSIGTLSGSSGGLITTTVGGPASLTTLTNVNSTYAGTIADGSGVVSLAMTGTGGLFLTGSNSYSGGTTITSGIIQNGLRNSLTDYNDNAFGTGTVVVSGSGSAIIRNNSTITNDFSIAGIGAVTSTGTTTQGAIRGSFGTSGQTARLTGSVSLTDDATIKTAATAGVTGSRLVLSGPIDLGSNVLTFAPGFASSGTAPLPIEVSGTIAGSGSVVVNGASAVYLNAANAYTGSTMVQAGTLGGDGSVKGAVIVQNGGIISPGADANTYGSFGVGSLQLDAGATAALSIGGTAAGLYDQIVSLGSVTYGGALAIDFAAGGFAVGDLWQLFAGSSHSGNFTSINATGAYGNLVFNYQGGGEWLASGGNLNPGESLLFFVDNSHAVGDQYKAGQLVLVPEPSTFMFAAIGVGIVGMARWKRTSGRRRDVIVRVAGGAVRGAYA